MEFKIRNCKVLLNFKTNKYEVPSIENNRIDWHKQPCKLTETDIAELTKSYNTYIENFKSTK